MVREKCCLFIDDDPFHQAVFTRALGDVCPGVTCLTATNGRDALKMMTEENVFPSYIFVEHNLSYMNGIEFLKAIKQIDGLKEIPVIVHSSSPKPHKVLELKESGALAIYLRPYEYWGVCNMLALYFGPDQTRIRLN